MSPAITITAYRDVTQAAMAHEGGANTLSQQFHEQSKLGGTDFGSVDQYAKTSGLLKGVVDGVPRAVAADKAAIKDEAAQENLDMLGTAIAAIPIPYSGAAGKGVASTTADWMGNMTFTEIVSAGSDKVGDKDPSGFWDSLSTRHEEKTKEETKDWLDVRRKEIERDFARELNGMASLTKDQKDELVKRHNGGWDVGADMGSES